MATPSRPSGLERGGEFGGRFVAASAGVARHAGIERERHLCGPQAVRAELADADASCEAGDQALDRLARAAVRSRLSETS
jgi:hypothetical protein